MMQTIEARRLLILGCGYVGERLARACLSHGIQVIATTRSQSRAASLQAAVIEAVVAASPSALSDLLGEVDVVVDSIPLRRDETGVCATQPSWLPQITAKLSAIRWAAYLSSHCDQSDRCAHRAPHSGRLHPAAPVARKLYQCGLRS